MTTLQSPLRGLKGIGPRRAEILRAAGLTTLADLLRLPPRRHAIFPAPRPVATLVDGEPAAIRVRIRRRKGSRRRGIVATRLDVEDPSGTITALLFGPSYLVDSFKTGEEVLFKGERKSREGKSAFHVRETLHAEELPPAPEAGAMSTGALLPHYDLPDGIPPRLHRRWLRAALGELAPMLATLHPRFAERALGRPTALDELYRGLHFPRTLEEAAQARRAFALAEALRLQVRLLAERRARAPRPGGAWRDVEGTLAEYRAALPYALTADQEQALAEIAADLARPTILSRLLSGDVGSGKTAVALFPCLVAARAGRQAALLVPTEILARQHVATLAPLLARLGLPPPQLSARGSDEAAPRGTPLDAPIIVGTHRLFTAATRFRDLATVVVDEQHKFGVRQRLKLWSKGKRPDLLLVSATPIPRTVALTLFGHMDISVLATRPHSDREVQTELLLGEARRGLVARLEDELARGGKVFVVCPAIAPASNGARSSPAAETVAPWLAQQLGERAGVALLHGRMDAGEKMEKLAGFGRGDVRVLVATVVVEVGIDVPDATLAVVLGAERFGLSQLHQIRGRVGRRGGKARCLLVSHQPEEAARARLAAFTTIDDGFRLAEMDLELRGPGELLGTRQHGLFAALYPEALADPTLLAAARALADERKSVPAKRFRGSSVASSEWIW